MKSQAHAQSSLFRHPLFIIATGLSLLLIAGMVVYKQNMGIEHVTHASVSVPSIHTLPYTRCPDGSSPDPDAKYNDNACIKPVVIYKYWPFPATTRPDTDLVYN